MNRTLTASALTLLVVLIGCERVAPDAATFTSPGEAVLAAAAADAAVHFVAPLDGGQEVPPADTEATGNAVFHLRGEELHYRLMVANIENVRMAHIHLGPAEENGPVVVWLYPDSPPPQLIPGRSDGILATGTITSDDLVGPLAGGTLDDLLDLMRDGGTYVNVHTSQFPGGEIRGQIMPAGRR